MKSRLRESTRLNGFGNIEIVDFFVGRFVVTTPTGSCARYLKFNTPRSPTCVRYETESQPGKSVRGWQGGSCAGNNVWGHKIVDIRFVAVRKVKVLISSDAA